MQDDAIEAGGLAVRVMCEGSDAKHDDLDLVIRYLCLMPSQFMGMTGHTDHCLGQAFEADGVNAQRPAELRRPLASLCGELAEASTVWCWVRWPMAIRCGSRRPASSGCTQALF